MLDPFLDTPIECVGRHERCRAPLSSSAFDDMPPCARLSPAVPPATGSATNLYMFCYLFRLIFIFIVIFILMCLYILLWDYCMCICCNIYPKLYDVCITIIIILIIIIYIYSYEYMVSDGIAKKKCKSAAAPARDSFSTIDSCPQLLTTKKYVFYPWLLAVFMFFYNSICDLWLFLQFILLLHFGWNLPNSFRIPSCAARFFLYLFWDTWSTNVRILLHKLVILYVLYRKGRK
jgi:hypothetical protein